MMNKTFTNTLLTQLLTHYYIQYTMLNTHTAYPRALQRGLSSDRYRHDVMKYVFVYLIVCIRIRIHHMFRRYFHVPSLFCRCLLAKSLSE